MVKRLPDLSFCGRLIVSRSLHCETRFVIGLDPLKNSKYLTRKTLDLTESKLLKCNFFFSYNATRWLQLMPQFPKEYAVLLAIHNGCNDSINVF